MTALRSGITAVIATSAAVYGYWYLAANGQIDAATTSQSSLRRKRATWLVRPVSIVERVATMQSKRPGSGSFAYDPGQWASVNSEAFNCYGYAAGLTPGRVPGVPRHLSPLSCTNANTLPSDRARSRLGYREVDGGGWYSVPLTRRLLRRRLLQDGLRKATWTSLATRSDRRWLVAAAFAPHQKDFHLWVLHNDGRWSHKPGEKPLTDVDIAGRLIRTPRRSRSELEYWFLGYFWVDPTTTSAYRLFTGGQPEQEDSTAG